MAPERLQRNLHYLQILSKAKKPQRIALINTANKDLILCLCDCALNFLNGNIPFTEKEIKKLVRYKNQIRYLARKDKKDLKKKKEVIVQAGGFLPLLLTPILSLAGSLIADAITSKQ
jgi:hypothetical protein